MSHRVRIGEIRKPCVILVTDICLSSFSNSGWGRLQAAAYRKAPLAETSGGSADPKMKQYFQNNEG